MDVGGAARTTSPRKFVPCEALRRLGYFSQGSQACFAALFDSFTEALHFGIIVLRHMPQGIFGKLNALQNAFTKVTNAHLQLNDASVAEHLSIQGWSLRLSHACVGIQVANEAQDTDDGKCASGLQHLEGTDTVMPISVCRTPWKIRSIEIHGRGEASPDARYPLTPRYFLTTQAHSVLAHSSRSTESRTPCVYLQWIPL